MTAGIVMLRHELAPLFEPESLIVIGDRPLPVMDTLPETLLQRTTQVVCLPGRPVKLPKKLAGLPAGERLDLALVCVAPHAIQHTFHQLSCCAPRAVILLPHEVVDPHPEQTLAFCRSWAQANGCAMLGPNTFGLQRPHVGLNLSQHPSIARSGRVALVSQSRSIMAAVMDWAEDVHIGFSTVVALGDEAVTRLPDVLDYLASDARTDSIALYLEETGFAREFMSALRAAASVKPVGVLKAGRTLDTADADAAFDAGLRRAGAVRVRYFVQLFSALKVLGYARRPRGRKVAVFSNGNGPPQLAMDLIGPDAPIRRAELAATTRRMLGKLLEPGSHANNPVITHQPLNPLIMREVLDCLLTDDNVDGVLVLLAPDARADLTAVATELAKLAPRARKPVITCFMGDAGMRPLRRMLDDAGTPAFRTPESAADAFGVLSSYHYNQQMLMQMQPPEPESGMPDLALAKEVIARVRADGRRLLSHQECESLLKAFYVPLSIDPEAASRDVLLTVPMAISVTPDRRFGPIIRFGAGGTVSELMGSDGGVDLPPLNRFLARRLVERSRIWRRSISSVISPQAYDHLLSMLEELSILVCETPDVEQLLIDPIYADGKTVIAASVRITLYAEPQPAPRALGYPLMAVHPYPYRWLQNQQFADGRPWTLRPIRPEDAQALQDFIRGLSEESRYMRFVSMMRELTPRMLARYTLIDYHRELALVATTHLPNPAHRGHPTEAIIGLAHYLRNPDGRGAEYALVIGDDWQRMGLGAKLMRRLIEAANEQGLEYIDGLVLASNHAMLSLMTSLGFNNDPDPDDPTMRRVWLSLQPEA